MTQLTYDTVETLVFDPVPANRNATRMTLYNLGFRRIEGVGSLDTFAEAITCNPPDLALCEAHGTATELCALIQSLRMGVTGYNPFIVIIVTAWEQSHGLVRSVLNSGADDLLLRPFSTATLGQRLLTHVERRKGFVVTSDYVGPDRRHDAARPSTVELFQPPNSFKMKAKERLTSEEASQRLDLELKAARESLNSEKLRRDAFQICVLWRLMQGHATDSSAYVVDLAKLREVTRGIMRRCQGTSVESAVGWCEKIVVAIEELEAGADRNASMALLGHAALNLNQVFTPAKSQDESLRGIDATVAIIKARMEADEGANRQKAGAAAR